ncbi:hypothetical protein F5884DRAFT_59622 [Xylogone sp. PMI_703]|nr:hypothetical protein F5884DRAFT_59622 [Xylogone sp. PMI_703]
MVDSLYKLIFFTKGIPFKTSVAVSGTNSIRLLLVYIFLMRLVLLYLTLDSRGSVYNKPQKLSELEHEISLKVIARYISTVHHIVNPNTMTSIRYIQFRLVAQCIISSIYIYVYKLCYTNPNLRHRYLCHCNSPCCCTCRITEPGFDELSLKRS